MTINVAIVGGVRTPFVKAAGAFGKYSFLDLGGHVVAGVVKKLNLKPEQIDELIFSTVLLDPRFPNAARELVIRSDLPKSISAHFISNNCISGLVAANMITEGIRSGRLKTGLAGGSESMSRPALSLKPKAQDFFLALGRARTVGQRLQILSKFRPGFIFPMPPSPKEPSTGLTMGQHCELSAKEFSVGRKEQDEWAFYSHQGAAAAQNRGYLAEEILPFNSVDKDNLIRGDTTVDKLAKLRPVFDPTPTGTLTAGNSSALTDGASVVCLMAEDEAKRQGREILGFIEAVQFAAIPPTDGLLMAPGLAVPKLLERANLSVANIDLFEIHEAFAAQVIANRKVWAKGWNKYPELKPIGEIPNEKINVNGGSIALGHPFAATGGRLLMAMANELKRRKGQRGVISVCAAGAMAAAVLIRRP